MPCGVSSFSRAIASLGNWPTDAKDFARHSIIIMEPELEMMELVINDRLGQKVRVKCSEEDTIGELKMLVSAHIGTKPEKIKLQKGHIVYKDHITIGDYELKDGSGIEMYYA